MTIYEAFKSAEEGNFVTIKGFDSYESMHYWKDNFYFEDGAIVTIRLLRKINEKLYNSNNWELKYSKDQVDREKLDQMHKEAGGFTLYGGKSYEDCILKG